MTRLLRTLVDVTLLLCAACGASVQETHYFAGFRQGDGGQREAMQFYRLKISGEAHLSNARYLSGTFDERAIDLFFNEMKSPKDGKLLDDKVAAGSSGTTLEPLKAGEDGAFMLIMSTNADSIANAIGSFAESQVVADSLTKLLNRDNVKSKLKSDAEVGARKLEAQALLERLAPFTDAQPSSASEAKANYLHALTALAQALGYEGQEFGSMQKAADWFGLEVRVPKVNP